MNKGGNNNNFKLTPEQIKEASESFDTVKLHALAKRYGVSHKTLVSSLRREGLLRPKKRVADSLRLPQERLETAIKLHLEGVTLEKICEAVSSTEWIVRRNLMAAGHYKSSRDKRNERPGKKPSSHHNETAVHFLKLPLRAVST